MVVDIRQAAEIIAATPAEHRPEALDKAERSYLQTLQDSGFERGAPRRWGLRFTASSTMEAGRGAGPEPRETKLKALHEELSAVIDVSHTAGA